MNAVRRAALLLILLLSLACVHSPASNPYESAPPTEIAQFKKVRLPFQPGTAFVISQGAFGKASHSEPGNEYSWDFDVPFGTPVVAVEAGKVLEIWNPNKGGSCDSKFSDWAHNIKIEHSDGTVAQYVHVDSRVKIGDSVRSGQVIAVTAKNGWICVPQLHFGIYRSRSEIYNSSGRKTLPLLFDGLPNGLAKTGMKGRVPRI